MSSDYGLAALTVMAQVPDIFSIAPPAGHVGTQLYSGWDRQPLLSDSTAGPSYGCISPDLEDCYRRKLPAFFVLFSVVIDSCSRSVNTCAV